MRIEIHRVSRTHEQLVCLRFLQSQIVGYDARAGVHERELRRPITRLLPRDRDGVLIDSVVLRASDADGRLLGAAHAHPPYAGAGGLEMQLGSEFATGYLAASRVLSGIAVSPGERSRGLGGALIEVLEEIAAAEGASWLTGFMDERNDRPDFYRRSGFTVLDKNVPLPRLEPFPVTQIHPHGYDGHWFFKQIDGQPARHP